MTDRFHRLLIPPALAGLLVGAAMVGMPGTASADTEGLARAVACRDGVCSDSNDPERGKPARPAASPQQSSGKSAAPGANMSAPVPRMAPWGGPVRPIAPWGAGPRQTPPPTLMRQKAPPPALVRRAAPPPDAASRMSPWSGSKRGPGGYETGGYKKVDTGAVCSADHASGDVALLCNNTVKNDLWIKISQWGHGNQVNVAVFFQNISQFGASGSGNITNTAADNGISADVTQNNKNQ